MRRSLQRWVSIVLLVVVGGWLAPLSAITVSAQQAPAELSHACVNPLSRLMRQADDPADCAWYEDFLTFDPANPIDVCISWLSGLARAVPPSRPCAISEFRIEVPNYEGQTLFCVSVFGRLLRWVEDHDDCAPGETPFFVELRNQPPTDIILAGSSVPENSPNDTPIGTLSAIDPDPGATFTFRLLDDAGGRFEIVGTQLQVADGSLLDHEAADSHQITVQVEDEFGGTYSENFTIVVTDVNEAPSGVNDTYTTNEDLILTADGLGDNPPGVLANDSDPDASDTLTVTEVNGLDTNVGITISLTLGDLTMASDGTFTFVPDTDINGEQSFTYTVCDAASLCATVEVTAIITIQLVNDPPTFTIGSNQTVAAGAGEQTVPNWATGFDPGGGPDEDSQTVLAYHVVSNDHPEIFSVQPAIAADGTLTYTPVDTLAASTMATIEVTVQDDGGTANGGEDTSASQSFTITVVPIVLTINDATASEGDALVFTLSLSNPAIGAITLDLTTTDGTATGGVDYETGSFEYSTDSGTTWTPAGGMNGTQVTIPDTSSGILVRIDTTEDDLFEAADETFTLSVTSIVSGTVTTASDSGTGTITEDDAAPTLTIGDTSAEEGQPLVFDLSLDRASVETITLDLATTDVTATGGDDFEMGNFEVSTDGGTTWLPAGGVSATEVTFAPGQTALQVRIDTTDDSEVEESETFTLSATSVVAGTLSDSSDTGTGTILDNDNTPPVANSQNVATDEDTPLTITLTGSDAESAPLSFIITSLPTNGTLHDGNDTSRHLIVSSDLPYTLALDQAHYIPDPDFNGNDSFTFVTNDGQDDSDPATVSITVVAINDTPTASNLTMTTDEDTQVIITLTGSDVDLDPLSFVITSLPTDGQIFDVVAGTPSATPLTSGDLPFTLTGNQVAFSPDTDEFGSPYASFQFQTFDGTVSSTAATVTVNVTAVNDAPVATDQNLSTDEDVALAITLDVSDVENDPLDYTITDGPDGGSLSGTAPNLTYTPNADFNGADSFSYTVCDQEPLCDGATVSITVNPVNDAPLLANLETADLAYTENDPATQVTTTITVSDVDSTMLVEATVTISAGYVNGEDVLSFDNAATPLITGSFNVTTGVLTLSGNDTLANYQTALRTVTYQNLSENPGASKTITFQVNDGEAANNLSNQVSRDIAITAVNDAPVNSVPDSQTTVEDTALVFSTANGNLISVSDLDAGANDIQVDLDVAFGTLTLATTSGLTFVDMTANGEASVHIQGTLSEINTALATLSYQPDLNFNDTRGTETLTILTDDLGNTGTPGPLSDSDTVSISVTAVNDPPVALAKNYAAQANMQISIPAASGLLVGATDPDTGDSGYTAVLTVGTTSATTPSGGTVTFTAATGAFTFDPPPGVTGNVTFTYTVCDTGNPASVACSDPATVTFTVAGPVIWFVDPNATTNGSGTLASPFNSMASAAAADDAGERVYVYEGTTTSGITLHTNEWLIGQGVTGTTFDALFDITPPAGTIARPPINGTRPVIGGQVTMLTGDAVRGLNIQPSSGTQGLTASGATGLAVGEVSVTTSSAIAVNLTNNSDGTFSFTSIAANGGTNGIVWSRTSAASGSFTVTGSGTENSGGTIQNTSGNGIQLLFARDVSLSFMNITNNDGSGVFGDDVTDFSIISSSVTNNGDTVNGSEAGLRFNELLGNSAITNTTVTGSSEDNLRLTPTSGVLTNLAISGSSLSSCGAPVACNGVTIVAIGSASVTVNVTNSTFTNNKSSGFLTSSDNSANQTINISGSTFTDNNVGVDLAHGGTGDFNFDVSNNMPFLRHIRQAIRAGTADTATNATQVVGVISDNTIGNGTTDSGSRDDRGISIDIRGDADAIVSITGNTISNTDIEGIHAQSRLDNLDGDGQTGRLDLTLRDNVINTPDDNSAFPFGDVYGVLIEARDTTTLVLDIGNNDSSSVGTFEHFRVRQRDSSVLILEGFSDGDATPNEVINNVALVETFVAGRNVAGSTADATLVAGFTEGALGVTRKPS